jgi:hypothetical protein
MVKDDPCSVFSKGTSRRTGTTIDVDYEKEFPTGGDEDVSPDPTLPGTPLLQTTI